jgi:hypothetical protein
MGSLGIQGVMVKCRGEPMCSPREGRHVGLPLPHEIQKTRKMEKTCVDHKLVTWSYTENYRLVLSEAEVVA